MIWRSPAASAQKLVHDAVRAELNSFKASKSFFDLLEDV
jgi:hypothetical protein